MTRSTTFSKRPCDFSTAADLVEPAHFWAPDEYDPERTLGPAVAATATLAGFPPDPEQRLLLDLAFAVDKKGKSLAFEVVVIAPRQNLKTGFLKQYALGQLFVRGETLVPWSSHEFATASDVVNELEALIDGSDLLRRRVAMTTRGNVAKRGAVPEIKLLNGARMIFKTRTAGGGRGLSGRKTILDEAYALQPGQVGALLPIMLAQPDPQLVAASSACRPESAVLWNMVERGRAGGQRRMVYAEWCAPKPEDACDLGATCTHGRDVRGCGCDKPEVIVLAHSAVRRGRIQLQSIVDMRSALPPEEYAREVMGWHDAVIETAGFINVTNWPLLADENAAADPPPLAFGISVSPDRRWAALGWAAKAAGAIGKTHLEVEARRPGVEWVIPRCVELQERYGDDLPFVLNDHGPAASLIVELRDAGINVVGLNGSELADATEQFIDGVAASRYSHGPQPEVDDAILAAKPRSLYGRMVFAQASPHVDIVALDVLPLASWGALRPEKPPEVWSIREMVDELAKERGLDTASSLPAGAFRRPDGVTFTPQ